MTKNWLSYTYTYFYFIKNIIAMKNNTFEFIWKLVYSSWVKTVWMNGTQIIEILVEETEWQYPQRMSGSILWATGIQFMQSKVGDIVKCKFNLSANEGKDWKYRPSIRIWNCTTITQWEQPNLFAWSVNDDLPF